MTAEEFYSHEPLVEDYWRGIILFGRNVASYKFALTKALLEIKPQSGQLLKLVDIAPSFSNYVTGHLKLSDKQATSRSSGYLDACRKYNRDEIDQKKLIEETVRYGFVNVIDAFHAIGSGEIDRRFYIDERTTNGGIRITDEFSELAENLQSKNLHHEVESRCRLVETAWELRISRGLIRIGYDESSQVLFALNLSRRRILVTSSRSALNGYQKGKCFYCNRDIMVDGTAEDTDVDHFFPHVLKQSNSGLLINGIRNLVLACKNCNRGPDGKFARIPSLRLLAKLNKRNEYLISSHHPLRETLIQQTGASEVIRKSFLNNFYQRARTTLFHLWEPEAIAEDRL